MERSCFFIFSLQEKLSVQAAAQGLAHRNDQQHGAQHGTHRQRVERPQKCVVQPERHIQQPLHQHGVAAGQDEPAAAEIGRASCRERV